MSLAEPVAVPVAKPFVNTGAWKSITTEPEAPRGALWMCASVGVLIPLTRIENVTVVPLTVIAATPLPSGEPDPAGNSAAPVMTRPERLGERPQRVDGQQEYREDARQEPP